MKTTSWNFFFLTCNIFLEIKSFPPSFISFVLFFSLSLYVLKIFPQHTPLGKLETLKRRKSISGSFSLRDLNVTWPRSAGARGTILPKIYLVSVLTDGGWMSLLPLFLRFLVNLFSHYIIITDNFYRDFKMVKICLLLLIDF